MAVKKKTKVKTKKAAKKPVKKIAKKASKPAAKKTKKVTAKRTASKKPAKKVAAKKPVKKQVKKAVKKVTKKAIKKTAPKKAAKKQVKAKAKPAAKKRVIPQVKKLPKTNKPEPAPHLTQKELAEKAYEIALKNHVVHNHDDSGSQYTQVPGTAPGKKHINLAELADHHDSSSKEFEAQQHNLNTHPESFGKIGRASSPRATFPNR